MKIYNVAGVAERLKISKQTLLRYEKKGIFPGPRRNRINRWREYTEEDVRKMEQILGRGFTLVELIMVLVIVSILAVMAVPRIENFNAIKLKAAVTKTTSDIRYVQQFCVSRHANCRITFNADPANSYLAEEEFPLGSGTWRGVISPFARTTLQTNFNSDPQYSGIKITAVSFGTSGTTNRLRFDSNGTPLDASGASLSSDGYVNFMLRGYNNAVYVTPNTGRVRIQ